MARPISSEASSPSTGCPARSFSSPITLRRWSTKSPCRSPPPLDQRPLAARSTFTRLGVARGARSTALPSALSRRPGWESRPERFGRGSIYETEVETSPAQLAKIALDAAEFGVEFHSHRDHLLAAQASIPDLSLLISARGLIGGKTGNVLSLDIASLRWTAEPLAPLRG